MSLINQMLRDLEARHRQEPQRVIPEPSTVSQELSEARTLLKWLGSGLFLLLALWLGSTVGVGPKLPMDLLDSSQGIVSQQDAVGQVAAAPASKTQISYVEPLPLKSRNAPNAIDVHPGNTTVDAEKPAESVRTMPEATPVVSNSAPVRSVQQKNQVGYNLLKVGLLETPGSLRLVLEFQRLPDFRILPAVESGTKIRILLSDSSYGEGLEIPSVSGPLLRSLNLAKENESLLLIAGLGEPGHVRTLKMPADQFHGERLLLDIEPAYIAPPAGPVASKQPSLLAKPVPAAVTRPGQPLVNKVVTDETWLSVEDRANLAMQAGLKALQKNDTAAAEASFSHALILQPRLLKARLQLNTLLLARGKTEESYQLLQSGFQLEPANPELRLACARQLLERGEEEAALDLLQKQPLPELPDNLEYHALRAALFQENGRYQESASLYAALLQRRPEEPIWWLGMAVSFDQTGEFQQAKAAYAQALAIPGLRPDLENYVRDRLGNL